MSPEKNAGNGSSVLLRTLVVTASLLLAAVYLADASKAEEVPPRQPLASLPMQFNEWTGRREADLTPEILAILGVDDYIVRTYREKNGASWIGLYVGYHASQRQGDTIHSPLNCLPGAGWQPIDQGRRTIEVRRPGQSQAPPIEVNRVVIAKGLDRQLVYYWYQSHGRIVASEYWGKIYTVLDSVRYNRTDAALVRVIVPIRDGVPSESTEKSAVGFVQALFPLLPDYLPS